MSHRMIDLARIIGQVPVIGYKWGYGKFGRTDPIHRVPEVQIVC